MTFHFSSLLFVVLAATSFGHPQYQVGATLPKVPNADSESFAKEQLDALQEFWDKFKQGGGSSGSQGPGNGGPVDHINICGHSSYDCVPYYQCQDGKIITGGEGLIDVRIQPQATCTSPDYPDTPGLCCLKPDHDPVPEPLDSCPQYEECVPYSQCGADGIIVTDGSGIIDIRTHHTSCWVQNGIRGRCCKPPKVYVDNCPVGSVCVLGTDCLGQALDASNQFIDYISSGLWSFCSYGSVDGVCCKQPHREVCPDHSVCVAPEECYGTALAGSGSFIDYASGGNWDHCAAYYEGVCCINPIDPQPANQCGVRNKEFDPKIDPKIANKNDKHREAEFGEFPWQTIIFYQNYTYNCGASLISHKHVITGAHCVHHLNAADIKVRFGDWQVNAFEEKYGYVDHNVHALYIHPDFKSANLHNNIAILELVKPVEFAYHINTICLPNPGQYFNPGKRCIATGWGKDTFEGEYQSILKKVGLPYVDHATCQTLLRKTRLGRYFKLDESFLCAGGEKNKDACTGDGGGPLVCEDEVTGRYVLVGITSWGIGCGEKDIPGVYADVSKFKDWIDSKVVIGGGEVPGYGK